MTSGSCRLRVGSSVTAASRVTAPAAGKPLRPFAAWIRTEVGRVLNVLVAAKRPAALILERLNFQNPALSRRLNRIIQNCGRAVIRAKQAGLEDHYGITSKEVNPAYTS